MLSCCCHVVVMLLSCCCHVVVMLLLCCCHVVVMLSSCCCYVVVMLLSFCCHVVVILLSCCCHVVVMLLSCSCHVVVCRNHRLLHAQGEAVRQVQSKLSLNIFKHLNRLSNQSLNESWETQSNAVLLSIIEVHCPLFAYINLFLYIKMSNCRFLPHFEVFFFYCRLIMIKWKSVLYLNQTNKFLYGYVFRWKFLYIDIY